MRGSKEVRAGANTNMTSFCIDFLTKILGTNQVRFITVAPLNDSSKANSAHPGSNSAKSAVSTLTTTSGTAAVPLSPGDRWRIADSAAPTAVVRSRLASSCGRGMEQALPRETCGFSSLVDTLRGWTRQEDARIATAGSAVWRPTVCWEYI